MTSAVEDSSPGKQACAPDSKQPVVGGGPPRRPSLGVVGETGPGSPTVVREGWRAGGLPGEGCRNTARQRPHSEFCKGQSGSPGALGPRQDCSPLVFSPVGSSSRQLRDRTHTRNPGSSQGRVDLRSQSRQQPMESGQWAPERPGPVLPEASFPHGRWGRLGAPLDSLQEPGEGCHPTSSLQGSHQAWCSPDNQPRPSMPASVDGRFGYQTAPSLSHVSQVQ